jgi:cell division protein FtsW (lipid II flippase)
MRRIPQLIGFLAFTAGLILAIVAGIVAPDSGTVILTLVVLGTIVGILNITSRDIVPLLIAAVALIVAGTAGFAPLDDLITGLGTHINQIVYYLARLMTPAAVIAAVRALVSIGFPKY